jgi:NAD+-dependent protein deacetylase sirtuin 6
MDTKRDCDGQTCVICRGLVQRHNTSYRISVPTKRLLKLKQETVQKLQIPWDYSNKKTVNYFHQNCWEDVRRNATTQNRRIDRTELNLMNEVEETIERFDSLEQLRTNAQIIAEMIKQSNRVVAFTGAGISVTAGIPTYRGADGIDTLDACGASAAALSASTIASTESLPASKKQKTTHGSSCEMKCSGGQNNPIEIEEEAEAEEEEEFKYESLLPTYSHSALTALRRENYLHYCITQNCDNLHLKSGFPRESLSELHGNVFCEYCEKCLKEYYRSYSVDEYSTDCYKESWYQECPQCHYGHYTGRKCSEKRCNGLLKDTIVNFGDDLHETVLGGYPAAERECDRGDLCLAIGTSLTVTPASDLTTRCKELVIINLQQTDFDTKAKVRCWATSDMMLRLIIEELGIAV